MERKLIQLLVAILGAMLLIQFFSPGDFNISAFRVNLSLQASGQNITSLRFNPFGEIRARTHNFPILIRVSLENIDLPELERVLIEAPDSEELYSRLEEEGRRIALLFLLRVLLLGALGGGLALFLFYNQKQAFFWQGMIIGLLFTILILSTIIYTYDLDAFEDPQFIGMLEAAPWMIALVEEGLRNLEELGERMRLIAINLQGLFYQLEEMEQLGGFKSDLRVLHVSDIHNNPVAFNFIQEIVNVFDIQLVIDTGDLTDYGTLLETEIASSISELPVPYVFIPGNHDSPSVMGALEEYDNVRILDGGSINIRGLIITGLEDPASTSREIGIPSREVITEYQRGLEFLVDELQVTPHLVAVHNFKLAEKLVGRVPTIIHGHTHSMGLRKEEGTTIINAGTTGAAGIRGFEKTGGIPYSLAILHYQKLEELELMTVDMIRVYSRRAGLNLERIPVN